VSAAEWVLRIFTALGGTTAVVLLLRLGGDRKKAKAETAKADADLVAMLTGSAMTLLQPLHEEITALRAQVHELSREITTLRAVLAEHGIPPPEEGSP
jgi:hypothetical protein